MRTRSALSTGWMVGVLVAGFAMTAVAEQPAKVAPEAVTSESAGRPANTADDSVDAKVQNLSDQVRGLSRSALETMVASRGLQAKRPRVTANEDSAQRAERQKDLAKWISDIEAKRSELEGLETELEAIGDQVTALRELEMTDAEVAKVVNLGLGIHNVVKSVQRGTRELDLAKRRGVNALEQPDS